MVTRSPRPTGEWLGDRSRPNCFVVTVSAPPPTISQVGESNPRKTYILVFESFSTLCEEY